jgi:hypothetical protein
MAQIRRRMPGIYPAPKVSNLGLVEGKVSNITSEYIYIYIYIANSSAEFFLINEQVLFSECRDLRNARLGLRSIASSIPNARY